MDQIHETLIRKNFRNVCTILNKNGDIEKTFDGTPNINEVIRGVAELNKNGIIVTTIKTGLSNENVTKIVNIDDFGMFKNDSWIKSPTPCEIDLPENDFIPFKSDSWVLGEFIVRKNTGKTIPKRFLKSQKLLDKFVGEDEILKKLLVLEPDKRSYTWELMHEIGRAHV